jgi:outer membrane protein assembly factor BamB
MAGPTTIELGVLPRGRDGAAESPEVDVGRSAWSRLRRPGGRRRWWSATAVIALLMATMTVAAAPRPPWLSHHHTIPVDAFGEIILTEQNLYVAAWSGSGSWTLTSYRLTDGSVRWQVARAVDFRSGTLRWYGMPVFLAFDVRGEWQSHRTTAFDPGTGRERWEAPGLPGPAVLPDNQLLLLAREQSPPGTGSGSDPAQVFSLTAIDAETGDEAWRLPSLVTDYLLDSDRPADWLVTMDSDGQLASYDLATGTPLAGASRAASITSGYLSAAGDVVLVRPRTGAPTFAAYHADTLAHRWTVDLSAGYWSAWCEPVICVHNGEVLRGIDPATGQVAWSADWLPRQGSAWVGHLGPPWPVRHILASGWLVDAKAGDPVLDLQGWLPLPGGREPLAATTSQPLLARYQASGEGQDEDQDGGGIGRTWFGRLRMDPPGIDVLGVVDGGILGCVVGTRHLVCEDEEQITLWRARHLSW